MKGVEKKVKYCLTLSDQFKYETDELKSKTLVCVRWQYDVIASVMCWSGITFSVKSPFPQASRWRRK